MHSIDPPSNAALSAPARSSEEEVSLLDFLIILAARKWFILGFTLVIALLAIVVALLLPVSYTATAVILPPQTSSAGSAVMSQLGSLGNGAIFTGGFGIKNPNDMYVAMFRSHNVEDGMVKRFNLKDEYQAKRISDAEKMFDKLSSVQSGTKDNLISISVSDKDAKRAAELANGYVDEYRRFSSTLAITEASQRRLFFEDQLQQAKDNLANAEEALKKTEQTTGLVQIDSQARALIESAASLRAQIAAKQVEIRGMRSFASDQNPDLQMAEQQLAGWQSQLSSLGGSQAGSGEDLLLSKGQVPRAGLEYIRKLRDVKYYDTIFELLAKQFEIAKLDEARQGSMIQVVDPAQVPDLRSFPKRGQIVILSTIVGFFMGIVWVLVSAGIANIRKNPKNKDRLKTLSAALWKV